MFINNKKMNNNKMFINNNKMFKNNNNLNFNIFHDVLYRS